ncbi:aldo/keto reductase family protein [Nitzschia inconspicua]|uniref:Aldo/keto reductase family protein n=1 Tax=Nitzschia inconspicua TaxID=303405 RepID=A0A9K3K605_9STRA|nr:aldo/keto reductase family protein [Nitzschia inconspicua]KAG7349903.1 aldo/keto reductase family protein [Nitzschia inconspicua]
MNRFCRHSFCFAILLLLLLIDFVDGNNAKTTTLTKEPTIDENNNNDAAVPTKDSFTTGLSDMVTLHDGNRIPVVGLGVALTGDKTFEAVQHALQVGYRLIDTASHESYGNEDSVGDAIRNYIATSTRTIQRDDIVVITKLWDADHGFYPTLQSMDESYDALNIGPIDLYMVHSPFQGKIIETWDAILYYQQRGYIKSVGVSNFGIEHLQAMKDSGRPLPTVNQIEMHPLVYKYRRPLLEWCQQHNIKIQAYGSIMHGYTEWLEQSDVLMTLQKRHPQKTTAQILLRWALQHEFLIIPKSSQKERITANAQLYDFELSSEDMDLLDNWGDAVTDEERNLYEKDWGWNPIDEASVKLGKTTYWPDYEGVHWDDEDNDNNDDEGDGFNEEL